MSLILSTTMRLTAVYVLQAEIRSRDLGREVLPQGVRRRVGEHDRRRQGHDRHRCPHRDALRRLQGGRGRCRGINQQQQRKTNNKQLQQWLYNHQSLYTSHFFTTNKFRGEKPCMCTKQI